MSNRSRNLLIGSLFAVVLVVGLFLAIRPAFTTQSDSQSDSQGQPWDGDAGQSSSPDDSGGGDGPGDSPSTAPPAKKSTIIGGPTLGNYYPIENFGQEFPVATCAIIGAAEGSRTLIIEAITVQPAGLWKVDDCSQVPQPYDDGKARTVGVAPCQVGLKIPPNTTSGLRNGCWIGVRTVGTRPAKGTLTITARWQCRSGEICTSTQEPFPLVSTGDGSAEPPPDPPTDGPATEQPTPDEPTTEAPQPSDEPTEGATFPEDEPTGS
ncbi:hypothetical protein [Nonomuraea africana]|uniref:Serine/threonine protein kinase n=1 Tax=Nonomuraea africana TaxID=46171 RepID=A0ABR9KPJ7_9ACTN|nr:hypothetical protein [Nonomuraea africana]MBE1563948.1 hypothetical protein [Nonomuraea africana]